MVVASLTLQALPEVAAQALKLVVLAVVAALLRPQAVMAAQCLQYLHGD